MISIKLIKSNLNERKYSNIYIRISYASDYFPIKIVAESKKIAIFNFKHLLNPEDPLERE